MSTTIHADPVPLRLDDYGTIRVGDSRIPLERIVESYQAGATPETIVEWFDTLRLADVHAAVAYYLNHRAEVDGYLCEREQVAEALRRKIEAGQPWRAGLKEELLRRQSQMEKGHAPFGQ
jgi:uncharacterized protein (DUF433 family)